MKLRQVWLIVVIISIIIGIYFIQQLKTDISEQVNKNEISVEDGSARVQQKIQKYPRAIELVEPDGYINVDNISITNYIGEKIILLDFWTYSCINCQRTLPYLTSWYEKYKDKGFVIIGIHTPEFEFEKDYENVKRAVEKFNIQYPVVQDNEYRTWRAYKNRYWPRKYLIDIDGFIVYDHIGEGAYAETERRIQDLLEERNQVLELKQEISKDITNPNITLPEFVKIGTPEIYFGYGFSRGQIGNKEGWQPGSIVSYNLPDNFQKNLFYLEGDWLNEKDDMKLISENGSIVMKYSAKKVNLVAGSDMPVEITVLLDGEIYNNLIIDGHDLYPIISQQNYGEHTLEIKTSKGIIAYTFTFG